MIMLVALLRHVQLEDTGENVATSDTDRVSFPISRQQGVHSEVGLNHGESYRIGNFVPNRSDYFHVQTKN